MSKKCRYVIALDNTGICLERVLSVAINHNENRHFYETIPMAYDQMSDWLNSLRKKVIEHGFCPNKEDGFEEDEAKAENNVGKLRLALQKVSIK